VATVVDGADGLRALVGEHVGFSDWVDVTQEKIDLFAEATGDHQWIHTDPERAAAESPFGGPVAHGFWTLSLAPLLLFQAVQVEGVVLAVNYGLNKLRFPAPVLVGSRVRMGVRLAACEDVANGVQATLEATFEVEGQAKPACVAELVFRLLFS
jgi:acyl dehydratase